MERKRPIWTHGGARSTSTCPSPSGTTGSGWRPIRAVRRQDGTSLGNLSLRANEPVRIDGYGVVRGVNYEQDFQGNGPALQVVIEKRGQPASDLWLLQGVTDLDRRAR